MVNQRPRDTVLGSEFISAEANRVLPPWPWLLAHVLASDGTDLIVGEFGLDARDSAPGIINDSTLLAHVCHVLAVTPSPKMLRVTTRRVVARVADALSFWYRSIRQFVCDPVSAISDSTSFENSVSDIVALPHEWPAFVKTCGRVERRIDKTLETCCVPFAVVHIPTIARVFYA
jgi:hypothetical protein